MSVLHTPFRTAYKVPIDRRMERQKDRQIHKEEHTSGSVKIQESSAASSKQLQCPMVASLIDRLEAFTRPVHHEQ